MERKKQSNVQVGGWGGGGGGGGGGGVGRDEVWDDTDRKNCKAVTLRGGQRIITVFFHSKYS